MSTSPRRGVFALFCRLLGVRLPAFLFLDRSNSPRTSLGKQLHAWPPGGTKGQWGGLQGKGPFAPGFYCGQEALLFFPIQRLQPGDFPSFKNGGLIVFGFVFFSPAEVTWVENTHKSIPCVPSLQPQAATFSHSPSGS